MSTPIHVCQSCGQAFHRPSALKVHMNTHTGAKPFLCPWKGCEKTFSVNSNMRRHLRTHADEEFPDGDDGAEGQEDEDEDDPFEPLRDPKKHHDEKPASPHQSSKTLPPYPHGDKVPSPYPYPDMRMQQHHPASQLHPGYHHGYLPPPPLPPPPPPPPPPNLHPHSSQGRSYDQTHRYDHSLPSTSSSQYNNQIASSSSPYDRPRSQYDHRRSSSNQYPPESGHTRTMSRTSSATSSSDYWVPPVYHHPQPYSYPPPPGYAYPQHQQPQRNVYNHQPNGYPYPESQQLPRQSPPPSLSKRLRDGEPKPRGAQIPPPPPLSPAKRGRDDDDEWAWCHTIPVPPVEGEQSWEALTQAQRRRFEENQLMKEREERERVRAREDRERAKATLRNMETRPDASSSSSASLPPLPPPPSTTPSPHLPAHIGRTVYTVPRPYPLPTPTNPPDTNSSPYGVLDSILNRQDSDDEDELLVGGGGGDDYEYEQRVLRMAGEIRTSGAGKRERRREAPPPVRETRSKRRRVR